MSRQRPNDTPNVRLSKSLSYILRHGAVKEGLTLPPDGFIPVQDILARPRFRSYSLADIQQVVDTNDKQRFALQRRENGIWWIRANQGHSLKVDALDLTPIADPTQLPVAVHGTYYRCWSSIAQEGLKRMQRNHIHLAAGLPGANGVISGMRSSAQIYIYIDVARAMTADIQFFQSENQVILTAGLGDSGCLPVQYFAKAVDADGKILVQDGQLLADVSDV